MEAAGMTVASGELHWGPCASSGVFGWKLERSSWCDSGCGACEIHLAVSGAAMGGGHGEGGLLTSVAPG